MSVADSCPMEEFMNQIGGDPIIAFYLKLTEPTAHETSLPMYNELQLRLAIKQICKNTRLRPNEVALFKQLLMFYYAQKYRSMEQLLTIMSTFTEQDVIDCFDRFNEIRTIWHQFIRKYLLYYMHREAFVAILYEWSRRYYHLYGQLCRSMLEAKAIALMRYLRWDVKYFRTFLKVFNNKLLSVNLMKETADLKDVTMADLSTNKIVADIHSKFSMLILDYVEPFAKFKKPNQFSLKLAIPTLRAQDFFNLRSKSTTPLLKVKQEASQDMEANDVQSLQETKRRTRITETPSSALKLAETEESEPAIKKPKIEVLKVEILKPEPIVMNAAIKEELISSDDEPVVEELELANDIKSEITIDDSDVFSGQSDIEIVVRENKEVDELSFSFCRVEKVEKEKVIVDNEAEQMPVSQQLSKTLDHRSAISYISALQNYAVTHGHFEAILLLDQVDTIFRENRKQ